PAVSAPAARPDAAARGARLAPFAGLLPPLLALLAWRQVPRGFFYSDDFQTLYDFANGTILRSLFEPAFGHVNTTRNGFAGLLYLTVGPRAEVFYTAVLLCHALNAFLLYRVAWRLLGARGIAVAIAAVWAVSPLHHGTLDWYAAHGHAWIATLILLMLGRLVTFEQRGTRLGVGEALAWGLALMIIPTSYGVGMGIAFSFPVVALVIAASRLRPAAVAVLFGALLVFAVAYVGVKAQFPPPEARLGHLAAPPLRDILAAWPTGVVISVNLVVVTVSAFVLGPWFRPETYPSWPDLVCFAALALVIGAALWRGTRQRWVIGLLLLTVGTFPLVAIGRAPMITEGGATWALTPRYHYLPQAALALALAVALADLRAAAARRGARGTARWLPVETAAWAVLVVAGVLVRPLPVELHDVERHATERALRTIRAAVRATPPGETAYIPNLPFTPLSFLSLFQGDWKFPGLAGVFVIYFPGDQLEGRRVRFVATDPAQLDATRTGGRIATLLIPAAPP
ncbi:MAG: hypothetical protein SF182_12500, partial [Deltaproteobacteria bacterium]|nr:hypothetical protein [Deltaproteobacteria bacterium]